MLTRINQEDLLDSFVAEDRMLFERLVLTGQDFAHPVADASVLTLARQFVASVTVKLYTGGVTLAATGVEGTDYSVDYDAGVVTIIGSALATSASDDIVRVGYGADWTSQQAKFADLIGYFGGGGAAVNPTSGYLPYNNSGVFGDSPFELSSGNINVHIGSGEMDFLFDATSLSIFSGGYIVGFDSLGISLIDGPGFIASNNHIPANPSDLQNSPALTLGTWSQDSGDSTNTTVKAGTIVTPVSASPVTGYFDFYKKIGAGSPSLFARIAFDSGWTGAGTKYLSDDGTYKTVTSFGGLANPSASIGLTAVNGSATTAMRSDAAQALSQAIAPQWTGFHNWSGVGISVGSTTDPGAGLINASTGFRIGDAAASGNYLRGNGTNFVSSAIQAGDLPHSFPGITDPAGTIGVSSSALVDAYGHSGAIINLTESSATNLFTVTLPTSGTSMTAHVSLTIWANDGTDFQRYREDFTFSVVNKAGSLTLAISTIFLQTAASSGTLTNTRTGPSSGNTVTFKANAVSSLTQTLLKAAWFISDLQTDATDLTIT